MNNLDQLVDGILEIIKEKKWAKKIREHDLSMTAREVAKSVLKEHKKDKEVPELKQLINEAVEMWEGYEEVEPQKDDIAELAKKNRLIK